MLAIFFVDARLVGWIHGHKIDAGYKQHLWWVRKWFPFLWPGHFFCTLLIALVAARLHRFRWRAAALLAITGAITIVNSILKWVSGRSRPSWREGTASFDFGLFHGGLIGLFKQDNLAFPSGDTALAAATAAALSYLWPRGRIAWWTLAAIVGIQRLAENAHHASDVLAAVALGLVVFRLGLLVCQSQPIGLPATTDGGNIAGTGEPLPLQPQPVAPARD